ncbi:hypothetical protein GcM3_05843 [Golovinomyces cichoracearum]|uniref:Secreted effector protein n=1 Tax=Golovinomyces cichoracearum TaxID=62708 RepID=A0A420JAQ2_9PEZI|nr:hypothetical protein GcM3_05843 [Golovinomyces cichoracearum]
MFVLQFTLLFLATSLGVLSNDPVENPQHLDAFGNTFRGARCIRNAFLNHQIYPQVEFACEGGKMNQTLVNDPRVIAGFTDYEKSIKSALGSNWSDQLHLAPLFREPIHAHQGAFARQEKVKMGYYRLLINESCDVVAIIQVVERTNRDGVSTFSAYEICNYFN